MLFAAVLVTATTAASAQGPPPPPAPPSAPATPPEKLEKQLGLDLPVSDLEDQAPVPVSADTLRPSPAPAVLDAYRADPDFQYDRPQPKGPTLGERLWRWFARTVLAPIAENTTPDARRWTLILLAVVVLGWAASRLLRAEGNGVFSRRADAGRAGGPLLDADVIADVDLDARLVEALARGDHREAVRVRYLLLLQALDAVGAIDWRRDKTNRQYVTEVRASDPGHAGPFARATRVFDAVWYGERPVPPALYAELVPLFEQASPQPA